MKSVQEMDPQQMRLESQKDVYIFRWSILWAMVWNPDTSGCSITCNNAKEGTV